MKRQTYIISEQSIYLLNEYDKLVTGNKGKIVDKLILMYLPGLIEKVKKIIDEI